jgi:hypothetical protein
MFYVQLTERSSPFICSYSSVSTVWCKESIVEDMVCMECTSFSYTLINRWGPTGF